MWPPLFGDNYLINIYKYEEGNEKLNPLIPCYNLFRVENIIRNHDLILLIGNNLIAKRLPLQ